VNLVEKQKSELVEKLESGVKLAEISVGWSEKQRVSDARMTK
jgi:hypothetical protein